MVILVTSDAKEQVLLQLFGHFTEAEAFTRASDQCRQERGRQRWWLRIRGSHLGDPGEPLAILATSPGIKTYPLYSTVESQKIGDDVPIWKFPEIGYPCYSILDWDFPL